MTHHKNTNKTFWVSTNTFSRKKRKITIFSQFWRYSPIKIFQHWSFWLKIIRKRASFGEKLMSTNLLWFEIFKIDLTTMKWYLSGQYRIYKERSLVCWCFFHHYWMILLLWSALVGTLNFPNHQLGKSKYVCNLRQICSRNF